MCNFPMNSHVRLLVVLYWSVDRFGFPVVASVINFLKGWVGVSFCT